MSSSSARGARLRAPEASACTSARASDAPAADGVGHDRLSSSVARARKSNSTSATARSSVTEISSESATAVSCAAVFPSPRRTLIAQPWRIAGKPHLRHATSTTMQIAIHYCGRLRLRSPERDLGARARLQAGRCRHRARPLERRGVRDFRRRQAQVLRAGARTLPDPTPRSTRSRSADGRVEPLPDIDALAVEGLPILTRDTRRYRTCFPDVELIAPRV